MRLLHYRDPLLTRPCVPFDFANPPFDPIEYGKELAKAMRDAGGVGLSANQVEYEKDTPDVRYRVFVIRAEPNIVAFNPRVVSEFNNEILLEEGCLSFPALLLKIKRARTVRARYQLPNGDTTTQTFDGLAARVFQHELDHLNGVLFTSKVGRASLDLAWRKWERFRKKAAQNRERAAEHMRLAKELEDAKVPLTLEYTADPGR